MPQPQAPQQLLYQQQGGALELGAYQGASMHSYLGAPGGQQLVLVQHVAQPVGQLGQQHVMLMPTQPGAGGPFAPAEHGAGLPY